MKTGKEKVCVGLSGGVDSSVAAQRLMAAGYDVVGVFIKTWQPDFVACTWEAERIDAMRVAAHLGIPFYTCDAEDAYKTAVADYMIAEYAKGRTPNPDVMCNAYVKFGAFLDFAQTLGATKVATGHYARVLKSGERYHLLRGVDSSKDQSYFLWMLTQEQLSRAYFPVGDTRKQDIRTEAEVANLPTFAKQDSQGVCFLGQIDMGEFLSHYVHTATGNVLDESGAVVGSHDGALLYTIGQRHGFTVATQGSETVPHYVVAKNLEDNTITVAAHPPVLQGATIVLEGVNLIQGTLPETCEAQFRYRQKPFAVRLASGENGRVMLTVVDSHIDTPSPGQSCVLYSGDACLGGGVIDVMV